MEYLNCIDRIRPDAPNLAAFGAFRVGVRTVEAVNRDQIDVLNAKSGVPFPRRDRNLTLEIWYPGKSDGDRARYQTLLRDGHTKATLTGRAVRNGEPDRSGAPYPVIVISHGYPGNRHLLSHFGENLTSKGYICVAVDHTDSLYQDQAEFASTLVNRPIDQKFVLDEIERLSSLDTGFLSGMADCANAGLIGYSMGGYGVIISAGGGITENAAHDREAAPPGLLDRHVAGSRSHKSLVDERFKVGIAIAPWGMERDIWDRDGLAGIQIPLLLIAGSEDEVSGYEKGVKAIFEGAANSDRRLLTFVSAGHNVAAPIPAPVEAWEPSPYLDFVPFDHYADPVWDTVRMNNIAQHFATAFLGKYVKDQNQMAHYLDLPQEPQDDWRGFPPGTSRGLELRRGKPGK